MWKRAGSWLLSIAERIVRLRTVIDEVGSWAAVGDEFGRRCPVLLYHHVGPERPGMYRALNVSAHDFEKQIRLLSRAGYSGILPSDWLRWLREGKGLSKKPVMITFDDSYADLDKFALPILKKHGFGGAVFVVTQRVGRTNTWDEAQGSGTLHLMTADQIRYWAAEGIEFGAHSRTHPHLTSLTQDECVDEIAGSRADLESILNKPICAFAYPFGDQNETVCEVTRCRFPLAFSIIEEMNYLRGDPHLLRRIYVGPSHSLFEFALHVRRGKAVQLFATIRQRVALRTRFRKALHLLNLGSS